jgi:hypothetical protein
MKITSLLLCSFISLSTFASETCFKADQKPSEESKIPETFCVLDYNFETIVPELPKSPYFQANVQTSLGNKSQKITFYDFETAPFKVGVTIPLVYNSDGVCSRLYRSNLVIEFKVDKTGKKMANNLSVFAREEETEDNCHLSEREHVINFTQI